ncbi:hypothetical protein ABID16_000617 [Rhizobium aquaticum]|uniref:Uncharacterized protein n=1 Tax=Rhizobium aquaticum TaxID=1549636 RepID=A0ABV2IV04_9HYPH
MAQSSRFERFYGGNDIRLFRPRHSKLVADLHVHPEIGRFPEEAPEAQSRVGRDPSFLGNNSLDPRTWHLQAARQCASAHIQRQKVFFPKDFSGMDRGQQLKDFPHDIQPL